MRNLTRKCPWCGKTQLDFENWFDEVCDVKKQISYFTESNDFLVKSSNNPRYDVAIKKLEENLKELFELKDKCSKNHPYRCM